MNAAAERAAAGVRWGVALGVVLLAAFVLAGRGLGASGAFAVVAADVIEAAAPSLTAPPPLADRFAPAVPWRDWSVLQLLGVFVGGALSALLARRARGGLRHASSPPTTSAVARALAGGVLMGLGARLAYGCTSGLALSGGALLATGAWVFIPVAFATAILLTTLARAHGVTAP